MRPMAMLLLLLGFSGSLAISACAKSSDEICEEACELWDNCTGAEDWYPYDECYDECKADGDWAKAYVKCLRLYDDCYDLDAVCG